MSSKRKPKESNLRTTAAASTAAAEETAADAVEAVWVNRGSSIWCWCWCFHVRVKQKHQHQPLIPTIWYCSTTLASRCCFQLFRWCWQNAAESNQQKWIAVLLQLDAGVDAMQTEIGWGFSGAFVTGRLGWGWTQPSGLVLKSGLVEQHFSLLSWVLRTMVLMVENYPCGWGVVEWSQTTFKVYWKSRDNWHIWAFPRRF